LGPIWRNGRASDCRPIKKRREGVDFFPLQVELEEKLYAAGIIKGSRWIKREGRPTDQAILTGRMIDRAIRPLFVPGDNRDIQVIVSVLAVDQENDHDIVSLLAASAVLAISGLNGTDRSAVSASV